jgi:hypothetical protein
MIPDAKILDDLKTERPDITPPLPAIFRMIPLLFFLSFIGCILLVGLFAFRLKEVTSSRDQYLAAEKASRNDLQQTRSQVQALEGRAKRASDLQNWTESARPIQPVLVDLGRSIGEDTALTELRLTRNQDNPNQLRIGVRMNTTSMDDLDRLLVSLQKFGYRPYSPEQKFTRGEIDYQAMLIWQNPNLEPVPPTEEELTP